jgi:hypothetical protein
VFAFTLIFELSAPKASSAGSPQLQLAHVNARFLFIFGSFVFAPVCIALNA